MKPIIEVKELDLTIRHSQHPLIQGVSFDVHKGEVVGLIGESGSGKTLTCKAIMRLIDEKKFEMGGSVCFDGMDMLRMEKKQVKKIIGKDLSMIMQNPMTAFDPTMKIGYQIIETIKAHTRFSKKRAYEMGRTQLETMNLQRVDQLMNSYPHTLSGGMLQRIMIGIALMLDPALIIADEATTALDVNTQAIILAQFKQIKERGIGMIVVTHDFGVLAEVADRVIVMKDGKMIESGDVKQIFHRPQAIYTKELLSARLLQKEVHHV